MLALKSISSTTTLDSRPIESQQFDSANSTLQAVYFGGNDLAYCNTQIISVPIRSDFLDLLPAMEYRDLAQTLEDMRDADDPEWNIDPAVYAASIEVASALFETSIPAPHVFSHGPKSVVFNWDDGVRNLYLTIGKTRLWAAASTEAGIEGQIELTAPNNNITGDFFRALSNTSMLIDDSITRRSVK